MVKQEMARVNINILGISELKWTGMGMNLTQMTIISTTVGKNPLEEMEQPSQPTKEPEMQYLGTNSKMTDDLELFPRQTIQHLVITYNGKSLKKYRHACIHV